MILRSLIPLYLSMRIPTLFFLILIIPALFTACKKEPSLDSQLSSLTFSTDTVLFDTVFTTIGSTTQRFRIYNNSNQPLKIDEVLLGKKTTSQFRFNIDGFTGPRVTDIEIPANDSLFLFVEVTIDPLNVNTPMVVEDSLLFRVNGKNKNVKLVAWGQDIHYINGKIICNETWMNDKPYLIYNSMLVDTGCILTIQPGARLHFHPDSRMYVLGTLKIQGTDDDRVTLQGDRLETYYRDIPSQWVGIWLMPGSKDNEIDFAEIKNGILGIQVDTNVTAPPTLKISNTIVKNMSLAGLLAQGSKVEAYNCEFSNCGQFLTALTIGGDYLFNQCTFANFWSSSSRSAPSLLISNYYEDVNGNIQVRGLNKADFLNCIVYGTRESEVALDEQSAGAFNYSFEYSLIKNKDTLNGMQNWYNVQPGFKDSLIDYDLNAGSFAIDKGNSGFIVPETQSDLKGRLRTGNPDLGAYEYHP